MNFVGAIDEPQQDRISGWAVTRVGESCDVRITVNGSESFTAISDRPRPDLAAKQQSRGAGGFRIDIASALKPGVNTIEVRFPDGTHVNGSPFIRRVAVDSALSGTAGRQLARIAPRLSASELEEISLDDVGFAVEHGVISVPVRPAQLQVAKAVTPVVAADIAPAARGWLARLRRPRCAAV